MNTANRKRLEAAGWRVGKAADFLGLSRRGEHYVEIRIALTDAARARRTKKRRSK